MPRGWGATGGDGLGVAGPAAPPAHSPPPNQPTPLPPLRPRPRREKAAAAAEARRDPSDPNNTLILNHSYYDSARRDTKAPAQRQGGGSGRAGDGGPPRV